MYTYRFYIYICLFLICTSVMIIISVVEEEQLQKTSNLVMSCITITDKVLDFSFTSTISLLQGKYIWLNRTVAKTAAFLFLTINTIKSMFIMLASIEKFAYCKYPFRHLEIFTMTKAKLYTFILI